MNLSDNPEKMAIVDRLVKEGAIDFAEAIKLLTKEVEFTYIPPVTVPWVQPYQPYEPFYGNGVITVASQSPVTDTVITAHDWQYNTYTSQHN